LFFNQFPFTDLILTRINTLLIIFSKRGMAEVLSTMIGLWRRLRLYFSILCIFGHAFLVLFSPSRKVFFLVYFLYIWERLMILLISLLLIKKKKKKKKNSKQTKANISIMRSGSQLFSVRKKGKGYVYFYLHIVDCNRRTNSKYTFSR